MAATAADAAVMRSMVRVAWSGLWTAATIVLMASPGAAGQSGWRLGFLSDGVLSEQSPDGPCPLPTGPLADPVVWTLVDLEGLVESFPINDVECYESGG